jgi:hypothetical protein
VRVDNDGGRAERENELGELVDEQLRRLEVHVRVHEAGDDVAVGGVELLGALVVAEARDVALDDCDVGLEPLAREDGEDPAAADDEIGRLVPTRHGQPSCEVGHANDITCPKAPTRRRRTREVCGLGRAAVSVGLARGRPDPAFARGGAGVEGGTA